MPDIRVVPGDPRDPQAVNLLRQSHALMQTLFEPEENHFLDIDELCVPSIHFFVARDGHAAVGCAALANKGIYGEIKSMFIDPRARGKGIAHHLMRRLETEARAQGLGEIKLETGDKLPQARSLYSAHGYVECGPFGDYLANKTSIFMVKTLT